MSVRTGSILILAARTLLPLTMGSTVSRSGWLPLAVRAQLRHWPQGALGWPQSKARANAATSVRLPMPAGPVKR
jgi:hypothetical protein